MNREFKKDFLVDIAFVLVISLIIYFAFKFVVIYLFPFIIGLLITALVQKPSEFISKKIRIKKGVCALVLVILTYIALLAIISFCLYKAVGAFSSVYNSFSENIDYFEELFESFGKKLSGIFEGLPKGVKDSLTNIFQNLLGTVAESVTSFVSHIAATAASFAPGVFVSVIVTIVASCYIAKDYDSVKKVAKGLISDRICHLLLKIKEIATTKIFKIIKGYLLIMLITFVELSVGFLLLRIKNAIVFAMLIALLDLLPVLGTGTILIPLGIINLISGEYFISAALIILYIIVLIVRNIIEPKVISHQVGLHPLVALLCIFIGLKLFGFVGMFFLPLIVVLIYNLVKEGELNFLKFKKS